MTTQSRRWHQVEVLDVFPYESSRKRMSVIVRLPPKLVAAVGGGPAERLYCKGADSVLLDLCEQSRADLAAEAKARGESEGLCGLGAFEELLNE